MAERDLLLDDEYLELVERSFDEEYNDLMAERDFIDDSYTDLVERGAL